MILAVMINDQISSTIASMKDIMVNTADDDDNCTVYVCTFLCTVQ